MNHQHLVDIAAPLLSDLPKVSPVHKPKSAYTGGDFRHKTDSEITHVALAFEVPGGWHQGKTAVIMKVIQTLMGGGASFSNGGPGKGMQSRLYLQVMTEYDWMQSISSFSTVYDDTGLFGIHFAAPSDFVAEAVDIAIRELTAIAIPGEGTSWPCLACIFFMSVCSETCQTVSVIQLQKLSSFERKIRQFHPFCRTSNPGKIMQKTLGGKS